MARCRFVQPDVVRLYLVDVHKRALAALAATPLPQTKTPEEELSARARRDDAIADLKALIAEGEADGHFIDVKRLLTAGENIHVYTDGVRTDTGLDLPRAIKNRLATYIVGWSLTNPDGTPAPFSESALNQLDIETYAEMRKAIDAHEEAVNEERRARKNSQGGGTGSSAPLPSVSTTAGDTNGLMLSTLTSTT